MIEWIALAYAANANNKSNTNEEELKRHIRDSDPFVVVKPFALDFVKDEVQTGFLSSLFPSGKNILASKPFGTYSVRRSDILDIQQEHDDNDVPYVAIEIHEDSALYEKLEDNFINIPGTLEEVTAVLNG